MGLWMLHVTPQIHHVEICWNYWCCSTLGSCQSCMAAGFGRGTHAQWHLLPRTIVFGRIARLFWGVHMGNLFFCNSSDSETNLAQLSERDSQLRLRWGAIKFMSTTACCGWVSKCDLPVAIQPLSFKIPISNTAGKFLVYNYRLSKYNVDQHGYVFPELVWQDVSRCATGPQDLSKWMKHARSWQSALVECLLFPLVAKCFSCLYWLAKGRLEMFALKCLTSETGAEAASKSCSSCMSRRRGRGNKWKCYYYSSQICVKQTLFERNLPSVAQEKPRIDEEKLRRWKEDAWKQSIVASDRMV